MDHDHNLAASNDAGICKTRTTNKSNTMSRSILIGSAERLSLAGHSLRTLWLTDLTQARIDYSLTLPIYIRILTVGSSQSCFSYNFSGEKACALPIRALANLRLP